MERNHFVDGIQSDGFLVLEHGRLQLVKDVVLVLQRLHLHVIPVARGVFLLPDFHADLGKYFRVAVPSLLYFFFVRE